VRLLGKIIWMKALTVGGAMTAYAAVFDARMTAYLTSGLDTWRHRFYFMSGFVSGATVLIAALWIWSFYRLFVCRTEAVPRS